MIAHESTTCKSVEWYTPEWIFKALGLAFDLDPSSPHDMETAVPATTKFTVFDDGLSKEWFGRVWLNPPYSKWTKNWMRRMSAHGNGIALCFSRTDAEWFHETVSTADAVLFLKGRIEFVPGNENKHKKSRAGAGTVMFAWGAESVAALSQLRDRGYFVKSNIAKVAA